MSDKLQALIDIAACLVPGLRGSLVAGPVGPAWHATPRLADLRARLAQKHPEAGPHYAAVRGWGLLVWQPICLGVMAAHLGRGAADLDRLSLVLENAEVCAYRFAPHAPDEAHDADGLPLLARQLTRGMQRLLPEWSRHARLAPKLAGCIGADCVLAALLALRPHCGWNEAQTRALGERWLEALDLPGASGFLGWQKASGQAALALQPSACCLHFRRRDGERCTTCPKRTPAQRLACLQAAADRLESPVP